MKLYPWSLRSIPELEGIPDDRAKAALKSAWRNSFRNWRAYLACCVAGLFAGGVSWIAGILGGDVWGIIGAGIGGGLGGVAANQIVLPVVRENVRSFLALNSEAGPRGSTSGTEPAEDAKPDHTPG